MCGIAGIIASSGERVDAGDVHRMCQTIVHRGPDDEGIYCQGQVGLGMRRLSIIDVSGGHQPIHNEDQTVWVVLNGEIYNFVELKQELEARGHVFYTHSDTEVIVHLYEEMGSDCVRKLRGMFAIALYDQRHQRLLLARDRLGKKPLHYALSGGRLLFGSEIKAILVVAPELANVAPLGILQYFQFGYIPDPNTAFGDIHKLPPGYLLEYRAGNTNIQQYWDIPVYGTSLPKSEEECLEELEYLLAEAVRIRLISEVPLGALLSGGVDSSLVVALMARASAKPVKTFSIGFDDREFNESQHARRVAERFGTEHCDLVVTPNIHEVLESLTTSLEEPFGDSSAVPTYYVSRMARQHVTVALSGDGGDELFAGYDRYGVHLRRKTFDHLPSWLGRYFRRHVHPLLPTSTRGRRYAFNASLQECDRYLDNMAHLPTQDRERHLFTPEFLEWAGECGSPVDLFRTYFDREPAPDSLSRLLYVDTKTYLTADVLTKVDRMSMLNSLEVRCPILDHLVVEYAASLPSRYKFHNGQGKYLLRKLAERLEVPSEVLHRSKQGFAMPLAHWWRQELREETTRILLEPRTLQRGYVRADSVRELLDEHETGRRNHTYEIWLLLILELWHRNFLEARGITTDFRSAYRAESGKSANSQSAAASSDRIY